MDKIAVIGVSCLLPGARTPEEFWRNLEEQRDSRSLATREDMDADVLAFFAPQKGASDTYSSMLGGYIRGFELDPAGFELPAERIRDLDNVAQWSLYTAREALRDSGYWRHPTALARCGLVLGNLSFPTRSSNHLVLPIYREALDGPLRALLDDARFRLAPFAAPRSVSPDAARISGFPAAVVAAALSLSPAFFSIDAACASSLYAVQIACAYLQARKTDLMLAGAVNAADPLFIQTGFSIFQALPDPGQASAPLDTHTAGLVPGEGAGMFVLKRYEDAIRDGDRIHAVILGIGVANDGRGQSVLSPNPKGQVLAFERAYADAGIEPASVTYVECHATGTALGDKVELNSMDAFFGARGAAPLVGSVKSNLGHLLTASGMPSMLKVILGMARGLIPPTINVRQPQSSSQHVIGPPQIVRAPVPWPPGAPRRAAVSAFGLGGTDAHIVFERGDESASDAAPRAADAAGAPPPPPPAPIAIVGMDVHFGACPSLEAFHETIHAGTQHFGALPSERWKGIDDAPDLLRRFGFEDGTPPEGAYLSHVDVDFLRYKLPANEEDRLIPQQLLALKVADNALRDAGIEPGGDVAVIIAMEAELALHLFRGRLNLATQIPASLGELEADLSPDRAAALRDIAMNSLSPPVPASRFTSFIGNIMASRVSAVWDFSGPSFTLSGEESSVFKAIELAQLMLERGDVPAVVVGAVDLPGGPESMLSRNLRSPVSTGPHTFGFDRRVHGWTAGEGAGAVVLKSLERATRDGDRVYAAIDAVAFATGTSADSVQAACRRALEHAGIESSAVGYVEAFASGTDAEDEAEIAGLVRGYESAGPALRCALGSVKANIGHTFAASGMASLVKTALCLHHRFVPGTPGWSAPKLSHLWAGAPFHVPTASRPWLLETDHTRRVAAVSSLGGDGSSAHLIMSERDTRPRRATARLADRPPFLLPLVAGDQAALETELSALRERLLAGSALPGIAASQLERAARSPLAPYGLAIVAGSTEECLEELAAAGAAVAGCFIHGRDWASPRGSSFTANPLGQEAKLAFVYPGGFSAYPTLGRTLFRLFPDLHRDTGALRVPEGGLLYPRSLRALTPGQMTALEHELLDTPLVMLETSLAFALLFTEVLRDYFRVTPAAALGYSMGEVSMLLALGAWADAEGLRAAVRASPLFRSRLAGPMDTVRRAWGLAPAGERPERIWWSYALRTSAAAAREALEGESRAYLIFVNSPAEVAIAGDAGACERVIRKLGCQATDLRMSNALHCEIARADHGDLLRMHTRPVHAVPGIDFYSAHGPMRLPLDPQTIAHTIADMYCCTVDFQGLVERAHGDGARVFVEVGPQERCTRWIAETLGHRRHLAVGVNRKGVDDRTSILRALARLHSHRVLVELAALRDRPEARAPLGVTLVKSTSLGGPRIAAAILTDEHRRRVQPPQARTVAHPAAEPMPGGAPGSDRRPVDPVPEAPRRAVGAPSSHPAGPPEPARSIPVGGDRDRRLSPLSWAHASFLQARVDALSDIAEAIRLEMGLAAPPGPLPSRVASPGAPVPARRSPPMPGDVTEIVRPPAVEPTARWDGADLLRFAEGTLASVFGPDYAVVDTYRRRVRLPTPPYLLVSRVTGLDATPRVLRPSSITTEYDVPHGAWYAVDGRVPWAVVVESGQCDLLLISYMGIDFECRGQRVYRLLDCTLTFLSDMPREGDTLRYDIRINSFARTGSTLLFFFEYDCFVQDRLILQMRDGCAGFFTDAELQAGKGVISRADAPASPPHTPENEFHPPMVCDRSAFHRRDLLDLVRGDLASCFGPSYQPRFPNRSLPLTSEQMLMIDRVSFVDRSGGPRGLGLIVAEKDLSPEDWYFPCHFKDDQVLAGSLMGEGCCQLLAFYMLYLGLHSLTRAPRFRPVPRLPQRVQCRAQVVPADTMLTYRMEIKEIGTHPEPYAVADVDILLGDRIVVTFRNVGLVLSDTLPAGEARPGSIGPQAPEQGRPGSAPEPFRSR